MTDSLVKEHNNNIFLIGLMGAGKTTIGKLLAQRLEQPFLDADQVLEDRCGVKISTIFDLEGEEGFRDRETDILRDQTQQKNIILATGGGAVIRAENRQLLSDNGIVVYLRVSPSLLAQRMKNDQHRPLLHQGKPMYTVLKDLHEKRHPLYEEIADITINSTRHPPKRIMETILQRLKEKYDYDVPPH